MTPIPQTKGRSIEQSSHRLSTFMLTIFTLSLALLGCEDEAPGREASRISLDMGSAGGEGGNGGGGVTQLQMHG